MLVKIKCHVIFLLLINKFHLAKNIFVKVKCHIIFLLSVNKFYFVKNK